MRELVDRYLRRRISRRGFIRDMAGWGFSVAAANSILDSLTPLVEAAEAGPSGQMDSMTGTVIEGTGGELLVEQLRAAGVRYIFNCNSSGSYPVFDALVDRHEIQVIEVSQEGQAISVAQGYTLASGKTAFTLNDSVGLPNTLNNMYNAWKDRTPLVSGAQREPTTVQGGRDAFEDWDEYLSPTNSFTRWRWTVDRAERVPEINPRAFKIAETQPEGPVALAFPDDVLAAKGVRAAILDHDEFLMRPEVKPSPRLVEEAARLLVEAKSPLFIVGPEISRAHGAREIIALAEQLAIPVTQGETLFADFPTNHALFYGDYHWPIRPLPDIDVVVNIGARMPYQPGVMPPNAKVVHASIDPALIGKVEPVDIAIVADVRDAMLDLHAAIESEATAQRLAAIREPRAVAARRYADQIRERRADAARSKQSDVPLGWEPVGAALEELLENDAIVVAELAGNSWLGSGDNAALSQLNFGPDAKTKIGRTTGAALGWGIGAALGVKLAQPDRQVVALQGDGSFMFAQAETLWTVARYEVPVIIVVFNNRSYNGPRNKILLQQGRQAETGRDMTCYLGNPDVDFAKVAAGFGVGGEVVRGPEELRPAIRRALDATRDGKPYLIDALVARTGLGAESTWYPRYSVADLRSKKI